ncbi:MAG: hypothetical protein GY913_33050 [Proteobacteria bacterium]|nr:hypothetical protein [Pseudomonadota bacterium]MCP4921753.1 hypothetical protein [Pseudomonadota bacterium]
MCQVPIGKRERTSSAVADLDRAVARLQTTEPDERTAWISEAIRFADRSWALFVSDGTSPLHGSADPFLRAHFTGRYDHLAVTLGELKSLSTE